MFIDICFLQTNKFKNGFFIWIISIEYLKVIFWHLLRRAVNYNYKRGGEFIFIH
ncbi:hypothetical protein BN134_577 [Cronobacter dublinensis 1210]|uniref:Uncharacterized protein n=1 Tax=Cronobacter dublinensis 1210 TaxID=1208656 RepID=A0ABP1W4M4_9ENTR|nr:hypothetical protein BN134_577 [Cronobacter dublinensis 1210]